jgi:adenylate cyclase
MSPAVGIDGWPAGAATSTSSMRVQSELAVSVRRGGEETFCGAVTGPVELGRLDPAAGEAERLDVPRAVGDVTRLAVADLTETAISRRQLRLERLPNECVRLVNSSRTGSVRFVDRPLLPAGQTAEYPLPLELLLGRTTVVVDLPGAAAADSSLQTLAVPTPSTPPGGDFRRGSLAGAIADLPPDAVAELVGWWRNVITVLQSATHSEDFFHKAAAAVVQLVGLDLGAVFLHGPEGWQTVAIDTAGKSSARPSRRVLSRLLAEKRTFFSRGDAHLEMSASLASLEAFVAAPILGNDEAVIGAVYGHRSQGSGGAVAEISSLEALLVETLACGVAAGLARLEQERAAVARKVQFEQFFSAELAEQLESQPDLLAGRDAEVTVLFCDIRGFSGITERLGPTQTMDWIGGVLSPLSECVAATGGVLVDYVGDELLAMWGAPTPQADHAARACEAARAMARAAPEIDARWQPVVGASTRFGIGINSGLARVGNVGSRRKFKYGPLGNCVNLASRVQGTTKYLRVPAIVTGSTRRLVGDAFPARRLCSVRVVNIVEPVDLFELALEDGSERAGLFAAYEEALTAFDSGRFAAATKILGDLLAGAPADGPALVLLSRAVACMIDEPRDFSPVWTLPGK